MCNVLVCFSGKPAQDACQEHHVTAGHEQYLISSEILRTNVSSKAIECIGITIVSVAKNNNTNAGRIILFLANIVKGVSTDIHSFISGAFIVHLPMRGWFVIDSQHRDKRQHKYIECVFRSKSNSSIFIHSFIQAFRHGAMGRRIDPSWGGPVELFLVPASAPRLV